MRDRETKKLTNFETLLLPRERFQQRAREFALPLFFPSVRFLVTIDRASFDSELVNLRNETPPESSSRAPHLVVLFVEQRPDQQPRHGVQQDVVRTLSITASRRLPSALRVCNEYFSRRDGREEQVRDEFDRRQQERPVWNSSTAAWGAAVVVDEINERPHESRQLGDEFGSSGQPRRVAREPESDEVDNHEQRRIDRPCSCLSSSSSSYVGFALIEGLHLESFDRCIDPGIDKGPVERS